MPPVEPPASQLKYETMDEPKSYRKQVIKVTKKEPPHSGWRKGLRHRYRCGQLWLKVLSLEMKRKIPLVNAIMLHYKEISNILSPS